jgi:hypothetical protein
MLVYPLRRLLPAASKPLLWYISTGWQQIVQSLRFFQTLTLGSVIQSNIYHPFLVNSITRPVTC